MNVETEPAPGAEADARAVLSAFDRFPDARVSISVGIEHWDNGRITLTLGGDGQVEVWQRRSGTDRRHQGNWDEARRRAYAASLLGDGVLEIGAGEGEREPDDVPVTIGVTRGPTSLFAVAAWYGDRHTVPALDKVLRAWEQAVSATTDGALPYGD
jgi:hypothetical protein